ncbi:YlxR family protein [Deinococcus deserti]|uniref:YlxR domain-containing protein n=1 Tax=Deinococcus deserti (strain DSM 17065 / CIP 109153 / LMG 22923 / VCD115) TaxID=546414 RepID=C1CUR0_DEIDV|nr:YlxR family protein [Deinococcus deserti]ACO45927.1 hypothetical protein Deide_10375 [Deinococcus deserti VCD115]
MCATPAGQPREHHVPERTCVVCRARRPQSEFVRLTRVEGHWQEQTVNRTGRGAYVCSDSPNCWQDKRLRRAFGPQAPDVAALLVRRFQTTQTNQPMTD